MGLRIVVGLDGTEYSTNAMRVGGEAIRVFGGTLIGVAVVDKPGIEASARGAGIGAYEYARQLREQRMSDAHERAEAFHDEFEEYCKNQNIGYELAYHDAVPFQAIIDEARFADAIVVGTRTHFHHETQSEPGDTLRRLMEIGVCPVVAVPRDADMPRRAIVAFDGSVQSARALRTYVRMVALDPEARSITLLHVGEGTPEDDQVQLIRAQQYVAGWGLEVEVMNRTGRPSEVIEQIAQEQSPCVVVMGAYGRRGRIRGMFFGSTAQRLIENERATVFVYH